MRICIFDSECNSLDTTSGFVQELAWAVYDVETWRLVSAKSHILRWGMHYEVDPGALTVTDLSRDFCELNGDKATDVMSSFMCDVLDVDFLCGHNILGYDKPMALTNIKRACFYEASYSEFDRKPVVDTLIDCPYPSSMKIHALKYLALDHNYILSNAHQAMADVMACQAVLAKYDFKQVLEIASTPVITLTSKIDFNDVESRGRIKNARFFWNASRKLWEKKIRAYHVKGIQLELGPNVNLEMEPT